MKKFYQIVLFTVLIVILAACGKETAENEEQETTVNYAEKVTENPIVTITMENDEKIAIELEPRTAPNTVANFISLVENGFYDGLIFHRVIPGFMIQGGDPDGTGMGGPDYAIKGEFTSNGFENTLTHERGVISMARSQDPDSAGSQFFIMTEQATHLDGDYAAFGKVTEGMETVDEIVAAERAKNDKPLEDQKIKTVEVDTKGFEYPEPVVQK
ncbi:peptidylprolyl isomerase [Solibacillus isronensis]|uniref:peptidylprolyl isomerase n=1 Tax=Solibacillus isronensis TaxID=412383 RepID=UPI00203BB605|nr:peptidylprolyl isomerase [Solibacillus isronensis]